MLTSDQAQLRILNIVSNNPEISQRQLAERLGKSLGDGLTKAYAAFLIGNIHAKTV